MRLSGSLRRAGARRRPRPAAAPTPSRARSRSGAGTSPPRRSRRSSPASTPSIPDVKVTVEDLGNQQVFDRTLAGCAAGGEGLPDVLSIENHEAEIFWAQFPDCFANLKELGYTEEIAAGFPDFKRTELEVGDVAYAMPWDSGPVVMFYRRDFYEKAGVDPATHQDLGRLHRRRQEGHGGEPRRRDDPGRSQRRHRMVPHARRTSRAAATSPTTRQSITVNQPGLRRGAREGQGDRRRRPADRGRTGTRRSSRTTPARSRASCTAPGTRARSAPTPRRTRPANGAST